MARAQVHYEVFGRAKLNAPWALQFATEDRHRALESADEMLDDGRVAAVQVFKETLDEHTREFQSIIIVSKGAVAATLKRKTTREAETALCVAPQDLYSAHARERIGRLLEGWLKRHGVTAFELLHRPDLVEALDASGVELQHAIQKIAIPEAQARGVTTHEVIRGFQKLSERAIERVLKDGKSKAFADIAGDGFAAVASRLVDQDAERAYLLGGGVAVQLATAADWSDKVSLILDLADAAPTAGRARTLALSVLEQPLAEILASHGGLDDLVGAELDLGGSLAAMTRLAAGDAVDTVMAFDPGLLKTLPPLPAKAERLAGWLRNEAFELVRAGLARRILRELKSSRRLRPSDPDGEIAVLRGLAMALTAAAGQLLPLEEVQDAFIERSKGLVAGDFVSAFLEGRENALTETQALIRLAENVAGPLNKRSAGRWIVGSISALRFEREAREGAESPASRLAALAALQKSVQRTGIAEADAAEISALIGQIGGLVEADAKLVTLVVRSSAPILQRLALLLRLASGSAAPRGPAAERAKTEAMKLLRTADARTELASAPQSLQKIRDLMSLAGIAA